MGRRKKRNRESDATLLKVNITIAIINLLNGLIALIAKLIELLDR